ncbi:hypothetical protein GGI21_003566 [Coemansia aciculifera]|nr:hypothetical protein GGI21_003566 [Coemansia aciculifera]
MNAAESPNNHNPSEQLNAAADGSKEGTMESSDDSHPESPMSPLSDENESQADEQQSQGLPSTTSADSADNMPSYRRRGQDFTDEHDVSQITPVFVRSNVKWNKADPIVIADKPMANRLAPAESHCCSVLRILPEQYLAIKHTLLKEGRARLPGSFKKRDAQRLCRIDVNKTSKIYEWFVTLGWLPESNGVYYNPGGSV